VSQTNLLDENEVRNRLASYSDPAVTDELYGLGQMLLRDAIDRIAKSDASAFGVAAYCGALIAVIVSSSPAWRSSSDAWPINLILLALFILAVSGALAIYSTTPAPTEWFFGERMDGERLSL